MDLPAWMYPIQRGIFPEQRNSPPSLSPARPMRFSNLIEK
jgi:hypothetical protein